MARNLKYQFKNAIDKNFKEGMDKHSLKRSEGLGNGRIYSYADRKNLIDFSSNFSNYMRVNFSDVKMARDIKSEHIQKFFNEKSKNCSKATMEQYRSKFSKLEKLVNKTYNTNISYSKGYILPISRENTEKIRNVSMSREEYSRLQNVINNSISSARIGIELSARFGLRVAEVTKLQGRDIDLNKGVIRVVDSKGSRSRDIEIQRNDKVFCEALKRNIGDRQRIVPLRENSVNVFLNRSLEKCDLKEKYSSAKTGIHSIRKMAAQDFYDKCREEGKSMKISLQETSIWLGHGRDRMELMKEYIENI